MKLKSEFDNLVSKIKIPGQEVSENLLPSHPFFSCSRAVDGDNIEESSQCGRQAQKRLPGLLTEN